MIAIAVIIFGFLLLILSALAFGYRPKAKQSDMLQKQTVHVRTLLQNINNQKLHWVTGGDFNLLPSNQYRTLQTRQRGYCRADAEISNLSNKFHCIASFEDIETYPAKWYSFYSNNPDVTKPNRTLDYLFYSPLLQCCAKAMRQHDTMTISDHFPIISHFNLKPQR